MKYILCSILFFSISQFAIAKTTAKATKKASAPVKHESEQPYSPVYSKQTMYNFRFEPVHLLIGAVVVNLDYVIQPDWTIGPTAMFWKFNISSNRTDYKEDFEMTYYSIGARATWFKNGVFTDGLYVGPSLMYVNAKIKTRNILDEEVTGSLSAPAVSCLIGYGWFWESFNMMLGGGGRIALGNAKVETKTAAGTQTDITIPVAGIDFEYSLGWTF